MAGDNEQLKADLDTGRTKFASAVVELQTIKDEIDQVTQNLSPEEEKWVGEASPDCQETLHAFDDASSDAITAMGDTSDALKQMRQGIIDAEEEAEREARKEEIANDVILVLSVVYLPLAGEAAGGTLDAGTASKAIQMIIDLDKKIADIFKRIAAAMKKLGKEFKTDLPEVPKIDPIEVDPIVQSPPGEISPPNVPDSKPAPTPEEGAPVQTPEAASPVEQPNTPNATNNEATPLNDPEVPPPAENQEPLPPAETPVKEPRKPRRDSGFGGDTFEMPGKPGESPTELPKDIAPRDPITVFRVETRTPVKSETTSSSSSEVQVVDTYADGSTTTTTTYLPGQPEETTTIIDRNSDGIITGIRTRNPDGSGSVTTRPTPGGPSSFNVIPPPRSPESQPTEPFKPNEGSSPQPYGDSSPTFVPDSPESPTFVPDSPVYQPTGPFKPNEGSSPTFVPDSPESPTFVPDSPEHQPTEPFKPNEGSSPTFVPDSPESPIPVPGSAEAPIPVPGSAEAPFPCRIRRTPHLSHLGQNGLWKIQQRDHSQNNPGLMTPHLSHLGQCNHKRYWRIRRYPNCEGTSANILVGYTGARGNTDQQCRTRV